MEASIQAESVQSDGARASQEVVYKNVKAYWEQEMRSGTFLPDYSSKYINMPMLRNIKDGKVLKIKQEQVVFRVCMTPPSKQVLVQKMELLLVPHGISSGIDHSKHNYPDKFWLILVIATLTGGSDEIFHPNYVPPKEGFTAAIAKNEMSVAVNNNIPQHLLGFGKGRHCKVGGFTKEEKFQQQI
jgi:hypothetical protein